MNVYVANAVNEAKKNSNEILSDMQRKRDYATCGYSGIVFAGVDWRDEQRITCNFFISGFQHSGNMATALIIIHIRNEYDDNLKGYPFNKMPSQYMYDFIKQELSAGIKLFVEREKKRSEQ